MTEINFLKMDGLGNDFVIIPACNQEVKLSGEQIVALASRSNETTGGCDQLVLMEKSENADCFMRIYNADGGEVDACGNASRCVAWLIHEEEDKGKITIETKAGVIEAEIVGDKIVAVDMGEPRLEWNEIPLKNQEDTLHLSISEGELSDAVGVSMGNPHAVFFVDDIEEVDLSTLGASLEVNELFPERANINIAQIESADIIRLRVWERGVGETLACGTGACATLVAAVRRELTNRKATLKLKGGDLEIQWRDDNHVIMTGPVSLPQEESFEIETA